MLVDGNALSFDRAMKAWEGEGRKISPRPSLETTVKGADRHHRQQWELPRCPLEMPLWRAERRWYAATRRTIQKIPRRLQRERATDFGALQSGPVTVKLCKMAIWNIRDRLTFRWLTLSPRQPL